MKSLLLIGLVLIWASLLTAYSLKDNLALGKGNVGPRVVGGRDAELHEFPYIVSIIFSFKGVSSHENGGSILNERWVITSAQSFSTYMVVEKVRAGAHYLNETIDGEQTSSVIRVIQPEEFEYKFPLPYDIALLELETPFTFTESVQPIALPPQDEMPLVGPAIATGWGAPEYGDSQNTLQTVMMSVLSDTECNEKVEKHRYRYSPQLLCTGGDELGTCNKDRGGPIVQNNVLIAVFSWTMVPCDYLDFPRINNRVSFFTNWINSHIN